MLVTHGAEVSDLHVVMSSDMTQRRHLWLLCLCLALCILAGLMGPVRTYGSVQVCYIMYRPNTTPYLSVYWHGDRGGADPMAFHAFRRAWAFNSLSLPFAAWWSPEESKDMAARARTVRVRPSRSEWQRVRRARMGGIMVSAGRHKSDCRSTAGEDQQGLRLCGLEGRRSMQ